MKEMDFDKALQKMMSYCAKSEKCTFQIKTKLYQMGINDDNQIKGIIDYLKKHRFLDEKRFANAFAKDKYNINKWGKMRIRQELSLRQIPNDIITMALNEIEEDNGIDDYKAKLEKIIMTKKQSLEKTTTDKRLLYQKLFRFAASKGYEFDHIKEILNKMSDNDDDMFL